MESLKYSLCVYNFIFLVRPNITILSELHSLLLS